MIYSLIYPRSKVETVRRLLVEIKYTRFEKYTKRINSSFEVLIFFAESFRTLVEFHVEIIPRLGLSR